jgi:hypothetical protein
LFFFVVILGAAALVVLREWFSASAPPKEASLNPAERRMREWEFRRQRAGASRRQSLCVASWCLSLAEFVYTRATNAQEPAQVLVAQNNQVRIPLSRLTGFEFAFLHRGRE